MIIKWWKFENGIIQLEKSGNDNFLGALVYFYSNNIKNL